MGKFIELDEEALEMLNDYVKQSDIKDSDKLLSVIAACLIEMSGNLAVITDILKKVEEESISNDKR
jgi:hypothetical protein